MKKYIWLFVTLPSLWGCSADSEFEIKSNYSYTLTKQEILTHRVFTADGEIIDQNTIASIFERVETLNPLLKDFPESTTTFDFDFSIYFVDQVAVLNRNDNLDTFKVKMTNKIIKLQSDTLQFITPGTYQENDFRNNIGKYSLNILDKENIPLYSGFGEKLTYTFEYVLKPVADKIILPKLFFYHFNSSSFPFDGSILSAEIINEINPIIYQYLNQGDTLLVNEINWILE